jgi:hypothetical protein
MSVPIGAARSDAAPTIGTVTELFRAPYSSSLNTMYDVAADDQRFVIVRHQSDIRESAESLCQGLSQSNNTGQVEKARRYLTGTLPAS